MNKPVRNLACALLCIFICLAFVACASQSLSGSWEIVWDDSRQEVVSIQDFGDGQWYIKGPVHELNGVYRLDHDNLAIVKPDLPVMSGFIWRKESPTSFVLVSQPQAARLQDHWLGAQLSRSNTR